MADASAPTRAATGPTTTRRSGSDRVIRWRPSVATAVRPALVGIVVFGLTARIVGFPGGGSMPHYERFGRNILRGLVPYRDYRIEYPPASIPAFLVPAPGGAGYETRYRIWIWCLGAVAILLLAVIRAAAGSSGRALYLVTVFVGVTPLLFNRFPIFNGFDFWPATLVLVALASLLCGYRRTAAGILGFAAAAKIYPLILLPLVLLFRRERLRWRTPRLAWQRTRNEMLAFVAVVVAVNLPFAIVGFHSLAYTYSALIRRPLQIESLAGSLFLAAHQLSMYRPTVYVSFGGSQDLAGTLPDVIAPATAVLMGLAVLFVWIMFARGSRGLEAFLTAAAASVAAFIAFGKVFSPEYQVWLIAIVPLASRAVRLPALALTGVALVLTRLYFPLRYDEVVHLGVLDWLVVARNLVIVALFGVLVVGLRRLG
jgi:hypothetical protein